MINEIVIEGLEDRYERRRTKLYSLDWLVRSKGALGFPIRTITELYANEGIGKTTLAIYLAGVTAPPSSTIMYTDLEGGVEINHLRSTLARAGFVGRFNVVKLMDAKKKIRSHASMCQESADALMSDAYAAIFDSLGAYASIAEQAKKIGEISMGRRAQEIGQLARRLMSHVRLSPDPTIAIFINHIHPRLGGRGHSTPGGRTKNFAAHIRIWMYHRESYDKVQGSVIELKLEKLRYGGKRPDERAMVFILPGIGVSPELTAVIDCVNLGIAIRDHGRIKIGDKSYGYLKHLIEGAQRGELEVFADFFTALEAHERDIYHT